MKEDADMNEQQSGYVEEPISSYAYSSHTETMMDELLQQSDDVKIMIIERLSASMRSKSRHSTLSAADYEAWKKSVLQEREKIRNTYHLPEDLVKLIGCVPPRSDKERENVRESYLREKYGL